MAAEGENENKEPADDQLIDAVEVDDVIADIEDDGEHGDEEHEEEDGEHEEEDVDVDSSGFRTATGCSMMIVALGIFVALVLWAAQGFPGLK